MLNHSQNAPSSGDIVEELLGDGSIKKYLRGRLLGKVLSFIFRVGSQNVTSSPRYRPKKDTQPKWSKRKLYKNLKQRKS